jgi:hypothetical protein
LHRLGEYFTRAVNSYIGVMISFPSPTGLVSLTSWCNLAADTEAHSSLLVPLQLICATEPGTTLILYAGTAGAFIDLAADLSWTFGVPPSSFALDEQLSPRLATDGDESVISGLAGFSLINQAIGVLIADGYPREDAHSELRRRAAQSNSDLSSAAAPVMTRVDAHPGEN